MHNHLVPTLLLVVLPALYLGHRLGWLRKPWGGPATRRWLAGGLLAAAAAWSLPWQGMDFLYVKRLNLFLAAAAALLLTLHHYRVPWTLERSRRLLILGVLTVLAAVNYSNYFAFHGHGQRVFVHLHDVAHYYLGAKYYRELGYTGLYTAMLRAEAEVFDNRFKAVEARDLETYERVHIRVLLRRSDPVKAAFTAARWADFRRDVAHFRQRLGPQWGKVLLDHGYNPTPVWTLLGGALANLVPAGSERGILLLCLLDPLLLALAFAAVGRAFGLETMLLSALHFCVVFGATFGWTGGAYLRYLWFFALVAGLAALHRRRYGTAGALLALSTLLRVFPAFFFLPLLFKAAALVWRRLRGGPRGDEPRNVDSRTAGLQARRYLAFFGSAAATAAVLFLATAFLDPGGRTRADGRPFRPWTEFRTNMGRHVKNIAPNIVGLTEALAWRPGAEEQVNEEGFAALKERRQRIHRVQLALVLLPALLVAGLLARRRTDLAAAALALPLLYLGLSLAAYYYAFLVVLILVHRAAPGRLGLIFAAEAAPYALMLFEDREALLFVYRGLVLAFLFLALELPRGCRGSTVLT